MGEGALPPWREFELSVSSSEGVLVVAVSGELDIDTMAELSAALAAGNGLVTTVVDLRGVTFIDSSGVSGVLSAARHARAAGSRLVCVPGPAPVQRVFALTGVDTALEWVDDPGAVSDSPIDQ